MKIIIFMLGNGKLMTPNCWSAVDWPASSICRESFWRHEIGVPNHSTMIRVEISTHASPITWRSRFSFGVMGGSWLSAVGLHWSAVVWPVPSICRESCWRQNMGVPNLSTMIRVGNTAHGSKKIWRSSFSCGVMGGSWHPAIGLQLIGQYLGCAESLSEGRKWVFQTSPL